MRIVFELRALTPQALEALLAALVVIDSIWLNAHPKTPSLYASGVRYEPEPPGQERFKDIANTIADGFGDCEDLACWRVAELRKAGERARPTYRIKRTADGPLYHVLVVRGDGRKEDPSRRLGMPE